MRDCNYCCEIVKLTESNFRKSRLQVEMSGIALLKNLLYLTIRHRTVFWNFSKDEVNFALLVCWAFLLYICATKIWLALPEI